jgi:hypothetical protein
MRSFEEQRQVVSHWATVSLSKSLRERKLTNKHGEELAEANDGAADNGLVCKEAQRDEWRSTSAEMFPKCSGHSQQAKEHKRQDDPEVAPAILAATPHKR